MSIWTERKIDCHNHLLDPDRFPFNPEARYHPSGQELTTVEQLLQMMQTYGICNALVVGPNSGYDTDNRCLLHALGTAPAQLKGIAVVPLDIGRDELAALKAQGVIGVAFNTSVKGVPYYRDSAGLLAHLVDLGMFLQLQFEKDELLSLLPLIEPFPLRLLIDHCGRPTVARGVLDPAFQAVLALGRTGSAHVKISGYNKFSNEPYPHRDTWPFITALVEAYTPDRCMWASDWPYLRTTGRVDVGTMLTLAERLFPDPADRAKLFYETPQRLFGYSTEFQATGTSR